MTAKQRRRAKRRVQRTAALVLVYLFEILVAAAPTAIAAAVFVPWAAQERGYTAVGGEWFLVAFVFYVSYVLVHNAVCDALYGKEE